MLKNKTHNFLVIIAVSLLLSCANSEGRYEQRYSNYTQYSKINGRNNCWFPYGLLKDDAFEITNNSFLATKCIFGIFSYSDENLYDTIFTDSAYLETVTYEIFVLQLEAAKNIMPKWFLDIDYWKSKQREIVLINKCYAYKDSQYKKIYYFHPKEEDQYLYNGSRYPGIRNTIR